MKRALVLFLSMLLVGACIDRVIFDIPPTTSTDMIVDGLITNEPGPYTVKLTKGIKVDDTRPVGLPFTAKKVMLFDNAGNSEELVENPVGVYKTDVNGIQGVVGREYHVTIDTHDNKHYESVPDKMNPVGAVDSIYYEFEITPQEQDFTKYGYRVFADAHNSSEEESFVRWRMTGTYVVETLPQYTHCLNPPCSWCPSECSGYSKVEGELKKGYKFNPLTQKYEYVIGYDCTCCRCWVTPREGKPKVSDAKVSSNGKYIKIEMGYIPIDYYTFFEKYRVEVLQMSLTREAYDYWKAVRSQKDATNSLFQPITGSIPTNIKESNGERGVLGLFYASAVMKKQIYLDKNTNRADIRVPQDDCNNILRAGPIGMDCRLAFPGSFSTTQKPADWN